MDGSDRGVATNVSEAFDYDLSAPAAISASDAGLFIVVLVRDGATFNDDSYRVYVCP